MNKAKAIKVASLIVGLIITAYAISGFFTGELYYCARGGCNIQPLADSNAQAFPLFYILFAFYAFLGMAFISCSSILLFHPRFSKYLNNQEKPQDSLREELKELDVFIAYKQVDQAKAKVMQLKKQHPQDANVHKRYAKVAQLVKGM